MTTLGRPVRPRRTRRQTLGGFTMVEVLTVAVVMGTLVRIALPNFHEVLLRARAAEVVGDFEVVRLAVAGYYTDRGEWPPDSYTGVVPEGLDPYLPDNFSFEGAGYRLDWENWVLPDGLPQAPEVRSLLGISVVTTDRELGQAVLKLLGGGMAAYNLGDAYTFVIERQ